MGTHVVKLSFCAPVHFGDGRLSDASCTCSADTLFSALFIEALAQGASEALLSATRAGKLLISDAFPWIQDTYYLPKPRVLVPETLQNTSAQEASSAEKKAFKKLVFIPREDYPVFFDGNLDANKTLKAYQAGIGKSGLITKVNLTRENRDEAEPYHVGSFSFSANNDGSAASGLYFLVRGDYDLTPLLETLQYSGLGGKRSAGYGRFVYTVQSATGFLEGLVPAPYHILLSTAVPKAEELNEELLKDAAYTLKKRAGFVQSTNYADTQLKKRDFYVFAAGSSFTSTFRGDVFDVSVYGAHPVWRYAKAFWMEG